MNKEGKQICNRFRPPLNYSFFRLREKKARMDCFMTPSPVTLSHQGRGNKK